MKTLRLILLLTFTTFCLAACNDSGDGTPMAPTEPGKRLNGDGTFTGSGGGNGIDGKVIEEYQKNIASLPEFKTYIAPLLRRMGQGRPDVMLLYFKWAMSAKRWYFVPVELPLLPKEKTKLAFSSDQLALQSDHEIFIYAGDYQRRPLQDRAALLLHEMVMGARLLMKASAQAQCEALSTSDGIELCKDPAYQKIAVRPPDAPITLDGDDHEAVRTMTATLLDPHEDVGEMSVYALRRRLGFSFPWDATMSRVTYSDLTDTLQRSLLANDRFLMGEPAPTDLCLLAFESSTGFFQQMYFGAAPLSDPQTNGVRSMTQLGDGPFDWQHPFTVATPTISTGIGLMRSDAGSVQGFESAGILDTSGVVVDQVTLRPVFAQKTGDMGVIVRFILSRDPHPRVLHYRQTLVRAIIKGEVSNGYLNNVEWVEVVDQKPMECKLATPVH